MRTEKSTSSMAPGAPTKARIDRTVRPIAAPSSQRFRPGHTDSIGTTVSVSLSPTASARPANAACRPKGPPTWVAQPASMTPATEAGWATHVGGPFGLQAALAGLALAVGLKLTDTVVPIESVWPGRKRWLDGAAIGLTVLSILAFVGAPGAMLLVDFSVLIGTSAITVYFVRCGLAGDQAARVAAPSAAVFALASVGAGVLALNGFQDNQVLSAIVGGFTVAGAVLLALAVAAGE